MSLMTDDYTPITHVQLHDLICRAIVLRAQDRRSQVTGKLIPGQVAERVVLNLSPELMRRAAEGTFHIPKTVNDVPVLVSEKPCGVNKPSGHYLCSVMAKGARGGVGYPFLAEKAETES